MPPERWEPDRAARGNIWPMPGLATAIGRGLRGLCPACGESRLFNGFLTVRPVCSACAAPLGLARADDAPPYFTILLVAHIIVPLMFIVERWNNPPPSVWVMAAIFLPLTLLLSVGLLRPIKGGTVGLMLNLNMLKSGADAV